MKWYHNTIRELDRSRETIKDKLVGWSLYVVAMYVLISILNEGLMKAGY